MRLLIVLRDSKSWRRACRSLRAQTYTEVVIAPLCHDPLLLGEAKQNLAAAGLTAVQVLVPGDFRQACSRARERLLAFTGEWPDRVSIRGRSFRELFVHRRDLSLWWLSELSQRNGDDRPTFAWLCELEVLKQFMAGRSFDAALICVDHIDLFDVFASLIRSHAGVVVSNRPRRKLADENRIALLVFLRWCDCLGELLHQIIVRMFCRRPDEQVSHSRRVYWHSWYPREWISADGRSRDRYYLELPELAELQGGPLRSVLLLTIRGVRSPAAVLRAVRRLSAQFAPNQFDMVQRYGRVRDYLRSYLDLWTPLRYWLIEQFSHEFRASFWDDGVDLFPILRNDLRISFLRWIPRWLATAEQFRRFAAAQQPDFFVTYLELYCYGRALIYGVKRGSAATTVVGYQHSATTPMKLVCNYSRGELRYPESLQPGAFIRHMPVPDRFALHGLLAERILAEGGYPPERAWVTGIIRLDHVYRLLQEAPRRPSEIPLECKVLLVAPPIWPDRTRKLLEIAIQAASTRHDLFTVFKLHPNYLQAETVVHSLAQRYGFRDYKVWNTDLYRILRIATVMFTTGSTAGAEAIAMGVPVIHLQAGAEIDLSPFFTMPEAVLQVASLEEFQRALDTTLESQAPLLRCQAYWPKLLRDTFLAVDGKAAHRFLALLKEVPPVSASHRAGLAPGLPGEPS